MRFRPVAIVGRSCLLPGALDPAAFASLVLEGRDLLAPAPPGRWRLDPDLARGDGPDRAISDRGGYVHGFDRVFDPAGFGLPATDVAGLDPLFQWVLHGVRAALRDADIAPRQRRTGLVLGNLSFPSEGLARYAEDVWLRAGGGERLLGRALRPDPRNRFMSGLPALLAAQALGLHAGALALDAACASSLYAIKLACDRLNDGRADVMVAGAVNRADDLFIHVGFTALTALSRTGRSRPFHRDADGLVPAEGAAFVVLRRLDDALAAGERILGVVRAVGLSNDGRGTGLLSPAEDGQARAMRQAYELAGLEPSDISLLECHATGTPVGDATELRSAGRIFAGRRDVPIGSSKSNFGHLITAAGATGLLKVLAGFEAAVRPPTLHVDQPLDALAGSPFRLLHEAEPWAGTMRRAGVSAFGFGGNNAHLIVEEPPVPGAPVSFAVVAAPPAEALAIVAIGAEVDGRRGRAGLLRRLAGEDDPATTDVVLDASGLRFPPRDLEHALPQQLLVLAAAREAVAEAGPLPRERTSVLVGMECDPEVARYGARWRIAQHARDAGLDGAWVTAARDALVPPLEAAGVLGTMPNLCANRINSQLDLAGPSFTVSAEELSGVEALQLACAALRAGEIDAALVGAVDVCDEVVHRSASTDGARPSDAAVVLVVKRLSDARRDGNRLHAVIDDVEPTFPWPEVAGRLGRAHAASGLVEVAAAALALGAGLEPALPAVPSLPVDGRRGTRVVVSTTAGARGDVALTAASVRGVLTPAPPRFHVYAGADAGEVARDLAAERESADGTARLVIVASTREQLEQRRRRARQLLLAGPEGVEEGIAWRARPIGGEVALVFTGPAGSYHGMGRDLLLALPQLVDESASGFGRMREAAGWIYGDASAVVRDVDKLWGSSLLCQAHARLTRGVLGLRADAAIGFCSGETNALFALGAWQDVDGMFADIESADVYGRELAGTFDAVRRAWNEPAGIPVRWTSWRLLAPLDRVREALQDEPRAHLTIINAPGDCVIGGDDAACRRVVDLVGSERCRPLGYDIAVHCPEMSAFATQWRHIHDRPTTPVPGVRFYSHARLGAYDLSRDAVADALLGQASKTVDFPALVRRAWEDGVRVFVEHGPQGGCTRWISRILGEREHVAVSLDLPPRPSIEQACDAVARLVTAGVDVDWRALQTALGAAHVPAVATLPRELRFPRHRPQPVLPPLPAGAPQVMTPPPVVAPIGIGFPAASASVAQAIAQAPSELVAAAVHELRAGQRRMAEVHRAFVEHQTEMHRRFLALSTRLPVPTAMTPAPARVVEAPRRPAGPRFSRADLEVHASGRISSIFGPTFAQQDGFARQVRMPEPPLLLADRVVEIAGEPGGLGLGHVVTETDVTWDAWYLHDGAMPAGIMIESGQADLFLISWLGIDFLNRGERIYRLLGCELTYHGTPPVPGETLRYDIHVDGHARHGDVRLFFFHYDCRVGETRRLSVRGGQAGFFTDAELLETGGVLWDAETGEHAADARVDPPAVACTRTALGPAGLHAFAAGRPDEAFGAGFEAGAMHVRSPRIAGGRMMLLGEVTHLDRAGGPWKRGYLRASRAFSPDDWFFDGHFKNDPCMPGTLMFEGCLQAMAVFLASLGYTLDKDGWRFQPVPEEKYALRCRGQATPVSRELVYEVFVEEVHDGPLPTVYADLLCTVDGVKAFHCRRMGLRLAPDWPLNGTPAVRSALPPGGAPAVRAGGVTLDEHALMATALGRPVDGLGDGYADWDDGRRLPRMPGPPYAFMSRVVRFDGAWGEPAPGTVIDVDYDVPPDAWYFGENGRRGAAAMPFAVLLEAALQPCGWLTLATGLPRVPAPLFFRNLDGTGTQHRVVTPSTGVLRTRVTLTKVSRSGGVILVEFETRTTAAGQPVFDVSTGFGFFPPEALAHQAGLPADASETERALSHVPTPQDVPAGLLGGDRLQMLHRVLDHDPRGGRAGLGRLRAEMDVDRHAWFFKAHFFQDPVQPGSLGLQAMLQALALHAHAAGLLATAGPLVSPVVGTAMTWRYRGQVRPHNRRVIVEIEVTAEEPTRLVADGWLWVDGIRIYGARGLTLGALPPA